jgi:hypothetical protein
MLSMIQVLVGGMIWLVCLQSQQGILLAALGQIVEAFDPWGGSLCDVECGRTKSRAIW